MNKLVTERPSVMGWDTVSGWPLTRNHVWVMALWISFRKVWCSPLSPEFILLDGVE